MGKQNYGQPVGLKTVLVATDFSPLGTAALDRAVSLAGSRGAKLLVVHVVDPEPMVEGRRDLSRELQQTLAAATSEAQAALDAIELSASLDIRRLVLLGNPADQIVALAAQDDIELVIIGASGSNGPKRTKLGRTAQSVAGRARCRVITVSEPDDASGYHDAG